MAAPLTILTVPGWAGSGPGQWVSLWERGDQRFRRVEQADWDRPEPAGWTATLDAAIRRAPGDVVLAAHSLGVSTIVRWAQGKHAPNQGMLKVIGALLVAPPDPEQDQAPPEIAAFLPVPRQRLPFPSILVASRTDSVCAFDRAAQFALWWGSELVDAGDAGHLNTKSGHGPWPDGRALLERLLTT